MAILLSSSIVYLTHSGKSANPIQYTFCHTQLVAPHGPLAVRVFKNSVLSRTQSWFCVCAQKLGSQSVTVLVLCMCSKTRFLVVHSPGSVYVLKNSVLSRTQSWFCAQKLGSQSYTVLVLYMENIHSSSKHLFIYFLQVPFRRSPLRSGLPYHPRTTPPHRSPQTPCLSPRPRPLAPNLPPSPSPKPPQPPPPQSPQT